jgi:hypothetical protein
LTEPTQLIYGNSPDGIIAFVSGRPVSTFVAETASRRAVALPTFHPGAIDAPDLGVTARDIINALGGRPTAVHLTIEISAGTVQPQETLIGATPPPTDPAQMRWQTNGDPLTPSFALVDNDRKDMADKVLFTIAVMLGVAGSALLVAVQSAIARLGHRYKSAIPAPGGR